MIQDKPGDIILYPCDRELSSRIVGAGELLLGVGEADRIQYSHAAIMAMTPGYQYEAKFPLTGRFKIDTSRVYEVWRIGDPTPEQRLGIIRWCREREHRLYDLLGVLTRGRLSIPGTYYCSRFACLAYASQGLHPGDLIMSPNSIPMYPGAQMIRRFEPPKGAA